MTTLPRQAYVNAVATNYVRLPGTPLRPSRADRRFASSLYEQRVPLRVVYEAFVLAIVRREIRSPALPRLPAIRTLQFFQGAIDEILEAQPAPDYIQYLAAKIKPLVAQKELALRTRVHDDHDAAERRPDKPSDSRGF